MLNIAHVQKFQRLLGQLSFYDLTFLPLVDGRFLAYHSIPKLHLAKTFIYIQEIQQLVALPGMKKTVAGRILSRLASPMIPLALVLYLTPRFGVAFAGTSFALYSVLQALGHVKLATMLETKGHKQVIVPTSVLAATALLLIPVFSHLEFQVGILVSAALCGLFDPPISTGIRSIWNKVADKELFVASAAFESF